MSHQNKNRSHSYEHNSNVIDAEDKLTPNATEITYPNTLASWSIYKTIKLILCSALSDRLLKNIGNLSVNYCTSQANRHFKKLDYFYT